MAVDNTHTKYLKGADKKAWNTYKEAYEAQVKFENFMSGLAPDTDGKKHGRRDIPVNKNRKKNND